MPTPPQGHRRLRMALMILIAIVAAPIVLVIIVSRATGDRR